MAVADFTGSDWLVAITALAAGIATIVGARSAAKHKPDDGGDDLSEFRAYVERTFVPRTEFAIEIQNGHNLRHVLRNEVHASINEQEDRVRTELRGMNQRIDNFVGGSSPRRRT